MKIFLLWKTSWIKILIGLFFLAACGGEEEQEREQTESVPQLECGPGTILDNGQCVVSEFDCDEGLVPSPAGVCLTPDQYCGTGASYDSTLERCVSAAEVSCGPGTIEHEGRCVVEDARVCGEGTVLADGFCRVSEEVCGAGTELEELQCILNEGACSAHAQFDVITGECVDLAVLECGENTTEIDNRCIPFHTFADELAADADLDYSDTERTIVPGDSVGDRVVFTGTMDSAGNLFHVFPFDGKEGQWLSITIYPRGIPSVGFRLREVFGPWERRSPPGLTNVPDRTVVPPTSGQYDLIVETTLSSAQGGPFSDPSWHYVGVVEVIEAPQAQPWDLFGEPTGGNLQDPTSNWLSVELDSDQLAIIRTQDLGVDARGAYLEVWRSPLDYSERFALQPNSSFALETSGAASTFYLFFDAHEFQGPRTHYGVSAKQTITLPVDGTSDEIISAQAGEVILLSHRSTEAETLAGRVFLADEEVYTNGAVLAENRSFYAVGATRREFFYAPVDGEYRVEFENTTGNIVEGFLATSHTTRPPTFEPLPEEDSTFEASIHAEDLERGDWRFVLIDTPSAVRITGTVEAGSGTPHVTIFDEERRSLRTFTVGGSVKELDFILPEEGVYFLAIRPSTTVSGGLTIDLDSSPVSTLEAGEKESYSFDAEIFDILSGTISYAEGSAPDVRLLNPDGGVVLEHLEIDTTLELLNLIPGTGTFTLEVVNNGENPAVGLSVEFEIDTPVDTVHLNMGDQVSISRPPQVAEDREVFLLRIHEELFFRGSVAVGQHEEVSFGIQDIAEPAVTVQSRDSDEVSLAIPEVSPGTYVVSVDFFTDIAAGYQLELDIPVPEDFEEIEIVVEFDPALHLAEDDPQTSEIDISGCDSIVEISVTTDLAAGWSSHAYVSLLAPVFAEPLRVRDGDFGTHQTTYPDDREPADSFDPLIGQEGNGVWIMEAENRPPSGWTTTATWYGWELRLFCVN